LMPPEVDERRLIMLICEGWLPQDKLSSRGWLCLGSEIAS